MTLISNDDSCKDELTALVIQAKQALGHEGTVNPDLLTVKEIYLDKGDSFFLMLDESCHVIGCGSYSSPENGTHVRLHRLYVRPDLKHGGISSALLAVLEDHARKNGKTAASVHLRAPASRRFEYAFYPKHGYREYAERLMRKEL